MWIIIIFSIFVAISYLSLVVVWLILGAIVNPEAFLPYATSVSAFITLILQKYKYVLFIFIKKLFFLIR